MPKLIQEQEQFDYVPTGGVIGAEAKVASTQSITRSITSALESWGQYSLKEKQKEDKIKEDQVLKQAAIDGSLAVKQGEFLADYKQGSGIYETAYNKAVDAQIASNVRTSTREQFAELSTQYANDKDGFKGAVEGLLEGMSEEMGLNEYGKAILQDAISVETERYLPSIIKNSYTLQKKRTQDAFIADQESLAKSALNAVRAGDDESYSNYLNEMEQNYQLGVQQGIYTEEDKERFKNSFDLESQEQMLTGEVERKLNLDTEAGIKEAITLVQSWRTQAGKEGQHTPDDLDSIRDKNNRLISAKLSELRTKNKYALELQLAKDRVKAYQNADMQMDYKNTEDKKAANELFDATVVPVDPETGATTGFDFTDPAQRETALKFAYQTGIIPEQLKGQIRTSLYSMNPEQAALGVEIVNRVIEDKPEFMNQLEEKDITFAKKVNSLTQAGMPLENALSETKSFYTLGYEERQKMAIADIGDTKKFNKHVTNAADDFVDTNFDAGIFDAQPETPVALKRDYETLYKHYLAMTDDQEAAKDLTSKSLLNKWSTSYINGQEELMPYPPEKVLANTKDEVDFITNDAQRTRDEVATLVRSSYFGVDPEVEVKFMPDANTYRGQTPKWAVYYKVNNGVWERFMQEDTPMFWTVDYQETPEFQNYQNQKNQAVSDAKEKEQELKQVDKMLKSQSRKLFY